MKGTLRRKEIGHYCEVPSAWRRFWDGVYTGDVWECECGNVFKWDLLLDGTLRNGWKRLYDVQAVPKRGTDQEAT